MNLLTWLIVGVIAVAILSIYGSKQREREIEKMFGGRAPLDDGEFYERYFAPEGVPMFVVLGVKRILEKELDVDLSRLRPEDDFATNLNYFWQADDWAAIDIVESFEDEFRIKINEADARHTSTIRDIVHLVWKKVQQKSA